MSNKTLRLGLVGPLPPPNGGMAMQTVQLARLLEEEGVDVQLLPTNAPYSPKFIEKMKGLRALFRLLPYLWKAWRLAGRVDVIHLMANSGWSWQLYAAPVIWIAWLRRTPVIVNYRGGEAGEYLAKSSAWVKPSLNKASEVIVPSGFLQNVFAEFGVPSKVIPNIIDLDTFCPSGEKVDEGSFTLVITRNLEPIYGLETAIRAIVIARGKIPGIQLKIAGSGPQLKELEQLVEAMELEQTVHFMGRLERDEVVALYQGADAMLNPTTVDNMPNSVLEALACGVPVISTNVGGVPYIVRDRETALLVPARDELQMARAIVELYENESLRSELVDRGREDVAQYSWDRVRPMWLSLYSSSVAAA